MGKVKIDINDTVFSRLVRHRANWKCERCTMTKRMGDASLHASHFIGRGNHRVRYCFDNVDALCYGCHQFFETHKQTFYTEFKIKKIGQERYDALIEQSKTGVIITKALLKPLRAEWRKELREKYGDHV